MIDPDEESSKGRLIEDMSSALRSMQVWAIYALVIGASLLLIPNVILGVFGIPETEEVWVRVVGVVVLAIDVLYWSFVRRGAEVALPATVYERWLVAALLAVLAFTTGPWQLVLFGLADFAGGIWTFVALRSDDQEVKRPQTST